MINRRFGRLTVIKFDHLRKYGSGRTRPMYLCQCDCGGTRVASATVLKSGDCKSCGCLIKENGNRCDPTDLVGKKIGMLTVLSYLRKYKRLQKITHVYMVRCDCGEEKQASRSYLQLQTATRSCGCSIKRPTGT